MSKTVKQHLINIMKSSQYNNEEAKHFGRKRIVYDSKEDKYIKKYRHYFDDEE